MLRYAFGDGKWETSRILAELERTYDLYFGRISRIKMPAWSGQRHKEAFHNLGSFDSAETTPSRPRHERRMRNERHPLLRLDESPQNSFVI